MDAGEPKRKGPSGAAAWATENVGGPNRNGWEYDNDCANFVSRALRRGGKFRQLHAHTSSLLGWFDKRSGDSWWENGRKNDSFTFAAAKNNYAHFVWNMDRTRISARYDSPQSLNLRNLDIGDVIYFLHKDGFVSHMGIVTTLSVDHPTNLRQIRFAQHGGAQATGSGPYMNLGERYDPHEFKGLAFARVMW